MRYGTKKSEKGRAHEDAAPEQANAPDRESARLSSVNSDGWLVALAAGDWRR